MIKYGVNSIFTESFAREENCIPLRFQGDELLVGLSKDFSNPQRITEELLSKNVDQIEFMFLNENEIERLINTYYTIELRDKEIFNQIRDFVRLEKFEALFVYFLEKATQLGASDIHLSTEGENCYIKFRIKGKIKTFSILDASIGEIIGRIIKVKGNADISRSLRPIDARISIEVLGHSLDIRVSIVNAIGGEKVSLRLLNTGDAPKSLQNLGISEEEIKELKQALSKSAGAIVVTGPTGSGKSTTLRCFIDEINLGSAHIISIEDPIEYTMPGVTQIQVDEKLQSGFSESVKSILRQDPDVIYIGEIRDEISAEVAMKASITGHLVFTTLHTKSVASAIDRLVDLGVDSHLIQNSISMIINQRLIPEQCPHCKKPVPYTGEQILELGIKRGDILQQAEGCPKCDYSGVSRRVPIMSIFNLEQMGQTFSFNQEELAKGDTQIKTRLIAKFHKGEVAFAEATKYL